MKSVDAEEVAASEAGCLRSQCSHGFSGTFNWTFRGLTSQKCRYTTKLFKEKYEENYFAVLGSLLKKPRKTGESDPSPLFLLEDHLIFLSSFYLLQESQPFSLLLYPFLPLNHSWMPPLWFLIPCTLGSSSSNSCPSSCSHKVIPR